MVWFPEPEQFRADQLAAMATEATGGDLHIAIAPSPMWLDDNEAAAAKAALAEVQGRYAAVPDNPDEPDFRELAELLTSPRQARFGWVAYPENGMRLGVLTAASRWFGLIAVREDDHIYVRTFKDDELSRVLTAVLPEWWKSNEQPISVLRSDFLAAKDEVPGAVAPDREVRRAQRVVALSPHVIAEFYAETRDQQGRRRVSKEPLRVYDNDQGRWTMKVTQLPGDERVFLAPASDEDVTRALDELRRELVS
ncbi:ESX secretion-associated protein EspG [Amycolatopsis aidingensis]|uniref:ESX secretion-associated protein EspG n=1 Tax=Amycolatopsis aidingensis TaxID=2842453 RepID=UPI001C0D7D8F|nr:ESX secretion-associated protein EspG [Amycolatopsis aidingensis]